MVLPYVTNDDRTLAFRYRFRVTPYVKCLNCCETIFHTETSETVAEAGRGVREQAPYLRATWVARVRVESHVDRSPISPTGRPGTFVRGKCRSRASVPTADRGRWRDGFTILRNRTIRESIFRDVPE